MPFFKRRDKFTHPIPHRGKVLVKKKIVKVNSRNATTRHSQLNEVFIGYEVGAGKHKKRFTSIPKSNAYSKKLLKSNKGLSGSGEERGVSLMPLYYGTRPIKNTFKKRTLRTRKKGTKR